MTRIKVSKIASPIRQCTRRSDSISENAFSGLRLALANEGTVNGAWSTGNRLVLVWAKRSRNVESMASSVESQPFHALDNSFMTFFRTRWVGVGGLVVVVLVVVVLVSCLCWARSAVVR